MMAQKKRVPVMATIAKKSPPFEPKNRSIVVASKYVSMIATFVSTEEARYYLTGIYIERHPVKGVVMVATDGHRMAVIHDENGLFKGKGGWICPVPEGVFRACRKKPRKGEEDKGASKVHFVGETVAVTDGQFTGKGPLNLENAGVPEPHATPDDGEWSLSSSLADENWVDINTILDESVVRHIIPRLKAAGARGIVEYPLTKIIE